MKTLTLILVLFTLNSQGQNLTSKKFLKGEWFVSNLDSSFFKSDTIILIKRTHLIKSDEGRKHDYYIENASKILNAVEYVNIEFEKFYMVKIWESYAGGAYVQLWTNDMGWQIKNDTLKIYSHNFAWTFKVILIGNEIFENNRNLNIYDRSEFLATPYMKLKRIN